MSQPKGGPGGPKHRVQYLVFTWVPEQMLEEWNDWHTQVHIPNILKTPQMRAARKYRLREVSLPGEWPFQYLTVYDLDSLADLHAYRAGPGVALRKEQDERWGDVIRVARFVVSEDERVL